MSEGHASDILDLTDLPHRNPPLSSLSKLRSQLKGQLIAHYSLPGAPICLPYKLQLPSVFSSKDLSLTSPHGMSICFSEG